MNIIKRNNGIILLEQYGHKYIRYDGGQIVSMILQVKITDKEFDMVMNEEASMGSVVNYYSNRGLCSPEKLRDDLIKDYLRDIGDYSDMRLDAILEKLHTHDDIFLEFYKYALYESYIKYPIKVEGMSAQHLAENYPLTTLGAYNYLIYLRENPEKALEDLKKGLPRRRVFDEKRLKEVQALIEKEKEE